MNHENQATTFACAESAHLAIAGHNLIDTAIDGNNPICPSIINHNLINPSIIDHNFTGTRIIHGDTLEVLKTFPDKLFGGIICDPPYASGAADQNVRAKSTAQKYSSVKSGNPLPDFEGDSKDQRSWTNWMTDWLIEARRCTKPGAPILMFIDWRQLPSMTDALQWAGWIWRGILVWDKTNSRPQRGRFRQQAEFMVWGSNGHMPLDRKAPILPGVFRQAMPPFQKRIHQTEKPLGVMRDLVKIVEPGNDSPSGGIILDPFAGAGTTVLAAALEGYPAVGIELSKHYADASALRIETALAQVSLEDLSEDGSVQEISSMADNSVIDFGTTLPVAA